MRVIFFGNGAFGLPTLRRLASSPHEVIAVVTNPDKPAGRGHKLTATPVKEEARNLGFPIWEVEQLKSPAFVEELRRANAHVFVVVAYRILPPVVWSLPPMGAINIHPSLLPAYRGPAPIAWTLIQGEKVTGVTIFRIQEGVDTGEILLQRSYPIPPDWNAGQLERFLSEVGADLLMEALDGIALGTIRPFPQSEKAEVSYAPKLFPENTRINWTLPAQKVYDFIRGLSPQPRAWTLFEGKRLQVLRAEKLPARRTTRMPGTLWQDEGELLVACEDAPLRLLEVQLEGKKVVSGREFAQGYVKNFVFHLQ
ncbi:MAG: methionyl-tRNA formyltransferase [Bacteroidia bacterium]|nr:methionyl-tRNA formyltransferase [Bacteroidia bacterium]